MQFWITDGWLLSISVIHQWCPIKFSLKLMKFLPNLIKFQDSNIYVTKLVNFHQILHHWRMIPSISFIRQWYPIFFTKIDKISTKLDKSCEISNFLLNFTSLTDDPQRRIAFKVFSSSRTHLATHSNEIKSILYINIFQRPVC